MKKIIYSILVLLSSYLMQGCKEESLTQPDPAVKTMDQLTINPLFNFSMIRDISVTVKVQTPGGEPMAGVPVKIYTRSQSDGGKYLLTAASDINGMIGTTVTVPAYTDSLWLVTDYIGLPSELAIPVSGTLLDFTYNREANLPRPLPLTHSPGNQYQTQYKTLGTWNSSGVPGYLLTPRDVISTALLNNINTSLPERGALPVHHPQYLAGVETNVILQDTCEVYVTFVHEGAGYRNVLGFYTFDKNNPPATIADIEASMTIIFPNASYSGSGGGLYSGDKVKIGNFGRNTSIGWFILSDGFKGANSITNGNWRFFSHPNLNPETNPDLRQHNVLLKDEASNRLIVGFEDIIRNPGSGGDNDFNDLLFYVSANPFTAIVINNVAPLDSAADADKDGITDIFDEYKNDPLRAFNNYSPAKNTFGTLAFEDLWPAKGDYDFNDLVVDYNFNQVTNAQNKVVEIFADLKIKAIGGSFVNAFGFQLPVAATAVSSVTGSQLTEGYISLLANGTEAGNNKATIIAFDNPYKVLNAGGITVNTIAGLTYYEPKTVSMKISFVSPVVKAELGSAPFNPFIIVNKERGKEVHLPGYEPTALADPSYFGREDDRTNLSLGRYYKSGKNLPWAVNFPESFDYPLEKTDLTRAYNYFGSWAESNAAVYKDWYQNKAGYRSIMNIYSR